MPITWLLLFLTVANIRVRIAKEVSYKVKHSGLISSAQSVREEPVREPVESRGYPLAVARQVSKMTATRTVWV